MRGRPFTQPEELGRRVHAEIAGTVGIAMSVRAVGLALAGRLVKWGVAYGGYESLAKRIEEAYGLRLSERTIRYALALLKREGYFRVSCCAGHCRGGRREGGYTHAATYAVGHRQLGGRGGRRVRLLLRSKGATSVLPRRFFSRSSDSKREEVRRSARFSTGRGDAAPPLPRAAAAATPERVDDGVGPVPLRELLPPLLRPQ